MWPPSAVITFTYHQQVNSPPIYPHQFRAKIPARPQSRMPRPVPYEWITTPQAPPRSGAGGQSDTRELVARLHLWPYRSLPKRGFVIFIGVTAALAALPLLAVVGSKVLWGVLPFLMLAVAGIWWALQRSYRDAEIVEDLVLTPDRITLTRHGPHGRRQDWQANPHWVRLVVHPSGGPVPNYLTLTGGPREVELGAFLSEGERLTLARDLRAVLQGLRAP